ncbi:MAG: M60 family metallopeptidase [Clostridiaceae bacterium]|nr:M60 family metallopeptidase [Clostridiaceae bacterium]
MKRKRIAILLALALVSSPISVSAETIDEIKSMVNQNKEVKEEVAKEVNKTTENKEETIVQTGSLEVEMNFDMPVKKAANDTKVTLKNSVNEVTVNFKDILSENQVTAESNVQLGENKINIKAEKLGNDRSLVTLNEEDVYCHGLKFSNLPLGTYELEVIVGSNIKKIENITIDKYSKRVILNTKNTILAADVNNDNNVNEDDYNEVFDNINSKEESLIKKYDLNKDGKIDITDLLYIHESVGQTASKPEVIDTNAIVNLKNTKIATNENILVQSNVQDLFNDEYTFKFGLKDESLAISEENPASMDVEFADVMYAEQIKINLPEGGNIPSKGQVVILTEDGKEIKTSYDNTLSTLSRNRNSVNSNIVINIGKQVAVKKVTIIVTGTTTNANLAEISKVEFLNNVYEEIPAPNMNIPSITKTTSDSEEITLYWNHEPNVTGYEIKLSGNGKEIVRQTTDNKIKFEDLDNYVDYEVSIQALNGKWKSGYSEVKVVKAKPTTAPEAPEGVTITGGYKSLNISWKKNKKSVAYNLYYRVSGIDEEYSCIENISDLNYTLTDLKAKAEYEVYLTGYNEHGVSPNSNIYKGETLGIDPPITPNYKLINTVNGENELTNNIESVEFPQLDDIISTTDADSVVDNDYGTAMFVKNWDTGVYSKRGPIVTFNKKYKIDTIVLVTSQENGYNSNPYRTSVGYFDEETSSWKYVEANIFNRNNKGNYTVIKLNEPVESNKIQVNPSVYGGHCVSIAELKFYEYDTLEKDVKNLFTDDLQIDITEDVNQEVIDELRERANTKCEVSNEYHPERDTLLKEIQYAEDILNDKEISEKIFTVNQNISNAGNNLGMANDWQALGLSAKSGEEIVVYVGTKGNVLPQLVFTQHYGESGSYHKTVNLKKGKNVIQVPQISSMNVEKGGSIYVRYPNATATNNDIKLRISGATEIPSLNLYGIINDESKEAEAKELIKGYINELTEYVNALEDRYPFFSWKYTNRYSYDEKTSILNSTDIELDNFTLNVPATAILDGITSGLTTEDEMVERVYNSFLAAEQIMKLTYAERGVSEFPDYDGNGVLDETEKLSLKPKSRMNIKYQRMFTGAFMYAANNHVGIEYDSVSPLMQGKPYILNKEGSVVESGNLFGWGIAHEIGHVTDINKMTYSETTNNILALLAQTFDDKTHSRIENSGIYDDIYTKVTSGTIGLPSNVFVTLGMFWQLHLAYDENPTSMMLKTDTDNDLTNDSFYARLSRRYRSLTDAEKVLDKDQLLIRIASEVAKKDLSGFFNSWGLVASEETLENVSKYEKEANKIQYLNDEARRQRLSNVLAMEKDTVVEAIFANCSDGEYVKDSKEIKLNLGVSNDSDRILGYEIYRNGEIIGFTTEDTFTDSLVSINNRALTYEVVAYDYHLNTTEKKNVGSIKISHEGIIDKSNWTIETNTKPKGHEYDSSCTINPSEKLLINNIKDNDEGTSYTGTSSDTNNPYVIIETNDVQGIVGVKYKAPLQEDGSLSDNAIKDYEIYVSEDKENWTLANKGTFNLSGDNNSETIYFNKEDSEGGKQLWTYSSSYVKIVSTSSKTLSIAELDLIAPPGDNADIDNVGVLSKRFEYADGEYIEAGSIIISGSYRGNPTFNTALLRDENNNIISGEQILLAEVPENAELGEISSGTWIYWISPKEQNKLSSKIKAELYRVNDALTNEGQRLVSDTLYFDIPETLPEIEIKE